MDKQAVLEIIVKATTEKAQSAIGKLGTAIHGLSGLITSAAGKLISLLEKGIAAGVGFVALQLKDSIEQAANFEFVMSGVEAVLGATAEEMSNLNELAKRLGRETIFTALDAAEALEMLARQGIEYEDIMTGAGDATLALAAATKTDMATAAEVAAGVMNSFAMSGRDVNNVVDLIAGTVNNSAATINDFRFSLQQGASTAHMYGMAFEDVATVLTLFAKQNVKGERAGSGLHMLLQQLTPATKKASETMAELGIIVDGNNQFFDQETGKLKDIYGITEVLQKSFAGLTDEQRATAMETIFGSRAQKFANILYLEGADNLRTLHEEISNVSAADIATTRMDNFKGAIEKLSGEIETAKISLGEGFLPILTDVALWLEEAVAQSQPLWKWLGDNAPMIIDNIKNAILGLFNIDVGGIADAFQPLKDFISSLSDLGPGMGDEMAPGHLELMGTVSLTTTDAEGKLQGLKDAARETLKNLVGEETMAEIDKLIENLPLAIQFVSTLVGWMAKLGAFLIGVAANIERAHQGFTAWSDMWENFSLVDVGSALIDGLWQGMQNAWTNVVNGITETINNFISIVKGLFGISSPSTVFSDIGTDLVQGLIDGIAEKWEELTGLIGEKMGAIKEAIMTKWEEVKTETGEKLQEKLDTVKEKFESIKTEVTTKMGEIKDDITEKWNTAYQNTMASLQQMWSEVRTKFDAILRNVADKMTAILGDISDKWDDVKTTTEGKLNDVKTTITTKTGEWLSEVQTKMTDIKNDISTKWDNAKTDVVRITGEIKTDIETKAQEWSTAVSTKMGEISTNVYNAWSAIYTDISKFAGDARDAVTSKFGEIATYFNNQLTSEDGIVKKAYNIGRGIVEQLKAGWDSLYESFRSAVETGIAAVWDLVRALIGLIPLPGGGGLSVPGVPWGMPKDPFGGAGSTTGSGGGAPRSSAPITINLSVIIKMGLVEISKQDKQMQPVAAVMSDMWVFGA